MKLILAFVLVSVFVVSSLEAKPDSTRSHGSQSILKQSKKFDPQRLIGLNLDTVRVFFAMIGRVTEDQVNGEIHLHALAADSMSHGIRPSEADAIVGPHGTRVFTALFYKLDGDQMKKLGQKDFEGGKVRNYSADLEWPNILGHVELNALAGTFILTCRAK